MSEKSIEKIVRSIVNKADFLKSWPKQSQENLVSEIVNSCNGDINNALNQIELASYSFQNKSGKTHQPHLDKQKDFEFSLFHTMGKFLYNKRLVL